MTEDINVVTPPVEDRTYNIDGAVRKLEETVSNVIKNDLEYGDYARTSAIMLTTIASTLLIFLRVWAWKNVR